MSLTDRRVEAEDPELRHASPSSSLLSRATIIHKIWQADRQPLRSQRRRGGELHTALSQYLKTARAPDPRGTHTHASTHAHTHKEDKHMSRCVRANCSRSAGDCCPSRTRLCDRRFIVAPFPRVNASLLSGRIYFTTTKTIYAGTCDVYGSLLLTR